MQTLILQVIDTVSTGPNGVVMEEKTNLIDLLSKGGLLIIPILILSIVAIYIFVERYLTIRKAANIDPHFMDNIKDYVATGNIEAAKSLCKNTDSPVARMIEKGVKRIGKPLRDIDVSIENVGKLEIYKMEKNLATLATISGAAPMIGFLGTVTGMIRAFFNMSKAGNNIDPSLLAGGIYEAMITTAVGLAVGIIAYICYNYLVAMVEKVINKMEAITVEFIDLLQEPAK